MRLTFPSQNNYLRSVNADVGHGGDSLEDVTEDVDHGDVDYGLELAEELIRDPCSKDRGEVAGAHEEMINCCSFVLKCLRIFSKKVLRDENACI